MLKNKDLIQSYEDLSYPNDAYAACDPAYLIASVNLHLSRLELKAAVDFNTDDLTHMRILEIGCACGGNIIPLAAKYPKMQYVGVDLSSSQIQQAKKDAQALKLKNIEFYAASILELDLQANSFDIVVAHGVLSWVSPDTANAILRISAKLLKESGLLYVSYNTLPGWYQEKAIRDMMEFHARGAHSPQTEIAKAREMLSVSSELATDSNYKAHLQGENEVIKGVPDAYLYHDYLETFNEAYYLKDVVEMSQEVGFSYIGDCNLASYLSSTEIDRFINQQSSDDFGLAAHIIQEQYRDLFTNRRFRQSIFIKSDLRPSIEPSIRKLSFLLNAQTQAPMSHYELSIAKNFELLPLHNENSHITKRVDEEYEVKLMAYLLTQGLKSYSYDVLQRSLQIDAPDLDLVLHALIYKGLITPRVDLVFNEPKKYAHVWHAGRYYASIDTTTVNIYHKNIHLDTASRRLLTLCDGNKAVSELVEIIIQDIYKAKEEPEQKEDNYPYILLGENMHSYRKEECKELVQFFVDDALIQFSKLGLLLE